MLILLETLKLKRRISTSGGMMALGGDTRKVGQIKAYILSIYFLLLLRFATPKANYYR
jgi:hypothetical protein